MIQGQLTLIEARHRAEQLWGFERLLSVRERDGGGFDVNLLQSRLQASDTRGRCYSAHRLNALGEPICHADCQTLT